MLRVSWLYGIIGRGWIPSISRIPTAGQKGYHPMPSESYEKAHG